MVLLGVGEAGAAGVVVGRQSLSSPNDYFHCQSDLGASCTNAFAMTTLATPGYARVPGDGTVTAWRALGQCFGASNTKCHFRLRVVRENEFNQYHYIASTADSLFFGSCNPCTPFNGTTTVAVDPPIPVEAGDYITAEEISENGADVRIPAAAASGAAYLVFGGYVADGGLASASPSSNYEPFFNADVQLVPPAPTAMEATTGPSGGGQTVTISGDHLSGETQVLFGGVAAASVNVVSDTRILAVTPAHGAGTVDVAVTTLGGTAGVGQYTYADALERHGHVYVTNSDSDDIWSYDIGALGLLRPAAPSVVPSADPVGIALLPDGRSAYVADGMNQAVRQYDVGPGGALTPKSEASVPAGSGPRGVAVTPDGAHVYVANSGFAHNIYQYDVGADGALTPKSPAAVVAGVSPGGLAVSPDGHSLYATDYAGALYQYDIAADGALAPKSPASVAAAGGAIGVAVTPDGRSVYVANVAADSISQYDVGAGGVLSAKVPATVPGGDGPRTVAVSPDGRSAYVPDAAGGVSQYDIGAGGALAPKSPPSVASGPYPFAVAISPDGHSVYVANFEGAAVSQYDVTAGGVLTPKSPSTVVAGQRPGGVAAAPDQGPVATFAATPGAAGSPTSFDATGSSDSDGAVARYDWDFGDGTAASDAGPRPTHVYAAAGAYSVALTVTDDAGCSTTVVFTGQTVACNGGSAAHATRSVGVPAPGVAAAPVRPSVPANVVFGGVPAAITLAGSGRFTVTLHAPAGLKGRATWRSVRKIRTSRRSKRRRQVTLATKSFTVPAGGRVVLKVQLSRRNLAILRLNRAIRTRVTVTLRDAANHTTTVRKLITLRAPKRRR